MIEKEMQRLVNLGILKKGYVTLFYSYYAAC